MPKKDRVSLNKHSADRVPQSEEIWSLSSFRSDLSVVLQRSSHDDLEFDMTGLDCSLVNTLRRVLIAEVPTMAIEKVFMYLNTSVMPDEMLAHRLGLVPLNVDPRVFNFPSDSVPQEDIAEKLDPHECLLFDFDVKCRRRAIKEESSLDNGSVYSGQLKWIPLGRQSTFFPKPIEPVHSDILLSRLTSGQEICFKALAVKGCGRDHTKFSPVATAFYRFHPRIQLVKRVVGENAIKLKSCFAPGVIEIDPGTGMASVANERLDTNSREVLRHTELKDSVELELDTRHFIFTVESIGSLSSEVLVEEALKLLVAKCRHYLQMIEASPKLTEAGLPTSKTDGLSDLCGRPCGIAIVTDTDSEDDSPLDKTFVFTGEDHTLGNALRYVIMRSKNVSFCGYCNPHPLEDKILFRIQSKHLYATALLQQGMECLRDVFDHMLQTFKSATSKFHSSTDSESTPMDST